MSQSMIPVIRFTACATIATLIAHAAAAAQIPASPINPGSAANAAPAHDSPQSGQAPGAGLETAALSPLAAAIRSTLDGWAGFDDAADETLFSGVRVYYSTNGYDPVWIRKGKPSAQARAVVGRIAKARYDGLKASDYRLPALYRLYGGDPERAARADIALSFQTARFITHLAAGRIAPAAVSRNIAQRPQKPEIGGIFVRLAGSKDIAAEVQAFQPPHPEYRALKDRLTQLLADDETQTLAEAVPDIAGGSALRLGLRDSRVAVLRARLDIPARPEDDPSHFDEDLHRAVKAYQQENNLRADGVVGPRTRTMLNRISRQSRIATLIVNMERWRWMPRDLGSFNVTVNVPEFRLRVNRDGRSVHETRVIVGKPKDPTPIFSDEIEHIVVNPYWNVPASIFREELLPLARNNPFYFSDHGYQVLVRRRGRTRIVNPWSIDWFSVNPATIKLRQRPGPSNALGRIKFMLPNRYAVYLHDTPAKNLFKRSSRAFSHGCVRVDKPMEFAGALLALEPKLNTARLRSLFGSKERWVRLETHVPIHLSYFTARIKADGTVAWNTDLYGYDAKLLGLLGI